MEVICNKVFPDGQVFALKLTLKSDLQSKTKEHASDGTSSVLEPEVELSHDGKIHEIAMDSADSDLVISCAVHFD